MSFTFWRKFRRSRGADNDEAALREARAAILADCQALEGVLRAAKKTPDFSAQVDAGVKRLEQTADQAKEGFAALDEARRLRGCAYRAFKYDNRIARDARAPNLLATTLTVQGAVFAEAALAVPLMITDGTTDVIGGIAYGLAFSVLNVASGLVTGFFACRYLGYRRGARQPTARQARIRALAWGGFFTGAGLIGLLNFAAARTRAIGDHAGIFDFERVGLVATFDNYFAIAIIVLGLIGAILGVYKGWTGISDPIPGFLALKQAAEEDAEREGDELHKHLLDAAKVAFDGASAPLEDAIAENEDAASDYEARRLALIERLLAHNDAVDAEKDTILARAAERNGRDDYVAQKPSGAPKPDMRALNGLKLSERVIPEPGAFGDGAVLKDALARVEAAYAACLADIDAQAAAFRLNAPAIHYPLTDEGE